VVGKAFGDLVGVGKTGDTGEVGDESLVGEFVSRLEGSLLVKELTADRSIMTGAMVGSVELLFVGSGPGISTNRGSTDEGIGVGGWYPTNNGCLPVCRKSDRSATKVVGLGEAGGDQP
jgi:hypothetical protein